MTDQNHAQAVIDIARASTEPHKVEPGSIYIVQGPHGLQTVDLTGDEYRDNPRHKTGHPRVADVASFAQYYAKHSDSASEVFADLDAATVTAVLDAHLGRDNTPDAYAGEGARWQAHRLTLTLVKTPPWVTWTGSDRKFMSQAAFAEFIEDNAADVAPGGPCTAADLLEMAQKFQAHTKVQFSSGKRLKSGETQLVYSETIDAKAGERGTIEIPDAFELALAPFEDCDPYRVKARFRYRLTDGAVLMAYHLNDPARTFRDAVLQVVTKAEEECGGVRIMRGKLD